MDIAKAVGAERLREIMAGLLDRATAVVGRYGGRWTSSPATGSWPSSVPLALEDHALRACRAALDIPLRSVIWPMRSGSAMVSSFSCGSV